MVLQKRVGGSGISYAWLIVFVLFMGLIATFGMRASFGAYVTPWEAEFSVTRSVVTSISLLSFVFFGVGQPIAGKLNDRFGKNVVSLVSLALIVVSLFLTSRATAIWQIFLLFGVGFSLGAAGCSNSIAGAIITNWFKEKRGFALGLATAGMAVGQLVMVPANLFIVEQMGWRTALSVLSIIILVVVGPLFIFFLRSRPEEKGMRAYGAESEDGGQDGVAPANVEKSLPILSMFKVKAFWLLAIPFFICGFTDVGLINTHLIPMVQEKGFPVASVAAAFSLIAITNMAGAIVSGHLADHYSRKGQLAFIYGIRAIVFIFLFTIQEPWLMMVFAVGYGAVEMASIAPTHSLIVQFFEGYSTGTVLGVISVSHQLGGAAGSWIPGLMYDLSGSYDSTFYLAIVILLAVAGMVLLVPETKQKAVA